MRIKTYNCCIVLLANYNAKVFKKAEYATVVAECELLGPLVGVCGAAFAVGVLLLGCPIQAPLCRMGEMRKVVRCK
jgi:hypothetical protein